MRDLKYLAAYLVPVSAMIGLYAREGWSWLTLILVFGILPAVELFMPKSIENVPETEEDERSKRWLFDVLLYLNAPLLFGITGWYLWVLTFQHLSWAETLGLTLATGIVAGANGINVAHELGHRAQRGEQWLAQLMLIPTLYQHFFVEHNRGHHKNVATDADPASARRGEWVFAFWLRSITGGWQNAWKLEKERLAKSGHQTLSWENAMLRYVVCQAFWLLGITYFFGLKGFLGSLGVALIGVLLLETVNYIEHYGLRRAILPSGRPEPVSPQHSWNSDHELGRIFLYELTRHSDHHYKANRKYQVLRHMKESPQLPFGYPASIVMSLLPPVWFKVMDGRIHREEPFYH